MSEQRELLYTFDPPSEYYNHRYGLLMGKDYCIKIYNKGNRKYLDIGKDYHMDNKIFSFSKPNGARPTLYQLWESQAVNEQIIHRHYYINDNFNENVIY